jgi:hypothetical protein
VGYRAGKSSDRAGSDSTGDLASYSLSGVGIMSWPVASFTGSGTYQTIPLPTALEVARVAIVVTAVVGSTITVNVNYTPSGGSLTPLFTNAMRVDNLTVNAVTYFIPDNPLLVIPNNSLLSVTHTFAGATSITFGLSLAVTCVDPLNYKTKEGNPGSSAIVGVSGATNYVAALAGW